MKELNQIDINQLGMYAKQIDDNMTAAADSFIRIGEYLTAARLILKLDADFKIWREENTCIKSSRTALAYMQVYRTFHRTKLSGKVGYSVLQELVSAPPEVIEQVEELVDAGESVTVKEAREMVKDSKSLNGDPTNVDVPKEVIIEAKLEPEPRPEAKPAPTPTPPGDPAWLTEERMILALPEDKRILEAKISWHVLGLSAYFETMPSMRSLDRLFDSLIASHKGQKQELILIGAISEIKEEANA